MTGTTQCRSPCSTIGPSLTFLFRAACRWTHVQFVENDTRLPVWVQLQRHCACYPQCQALLLQGLFQTLAEQQRAAALEQQMRHRQEEMQQQRQHEMQQQQEMLQAQVVQLQQQVDGYRRKLSATRSEAAELRGRVTALEGQLAQVLQALQHQQQ